MAAVRLAIALILASCGRPAAVPLPTVAVAPALPAALDAGPLVVAPSVVSPDPNGFEVWGIDVSHHQHRIDWPQVAQQPRVRFAFMKATQGIHHVDPAFRRNWAGARAAGLKVGAYHYFSFCTDPLEQAHHFLSVVPTVRDGLPAVLDIERAYNCDPDPNPEQVRAGLRVWLTEVEAATGRRPLIYATADILGQYLRGSSLDNPLWVRCTVFDPEPVLDLPWRFLQYDDTQKLPGIDTEVDRDVFAGNAEALVELTKPRRTTRLRHGR